MATKKSSQKEIDRKIQLSNELFKEYRDNKDYATIGAWFFEAFIFTKSKRLMNNYHRLYNSLTKKERKLIERV